jgi:hypothetical protein
VKPTGRDAEILGRWNYWVTDGHDRAERQRRLAEVPEYFRASVESHVRLVFTLRGQAGLGRGVKNLKGPAGGDAPGRLTQPALQESASYD